MRDDNVIDAWLQRKARNGARLRTDGDTLWLYATPIAYRRTPESHRVVVTCGGWETSLTRRWVAKVLDKLQSSSLHVCSRTFNGDEIKRKLFSEPTTEIVV